MLIEKPLVSIVIPCYNHGKYVQEAIQSVIDQDYDNIEFIIIDDGSSDDSVSKIQKMIPACEQRFKRFEFRHRPNKGLCNTLNEALEWCEGECFSPLASDDLALPYKISYLMKKIKIERVDAAFGLIRLFPNKDTLNEGKGEEREHSFKDLFFQKNLPAAPTAMIKTDVLKKVGGYNENVIIEDWYMWLTLTNAGYVLKTYSEVLVLYRRHESNITNDFEKMHREKIKVLSFFEKEPLYTSAIKNEYLIEARRFAYFDFKTSMSFLKKAGWINRYTLLIFIKALMPKYFINIVAFLRARV